MSRLDAIRDERRPVTVTVFVMLVVVAGFAVPAGAAVQSGGAGAAPSTNATAATVNAATSSDYCYIVAKQSDDLIRVNKFTGDNSSIPLVGSSKNITDMSFRPGTAELYAVFGQDSLARIDVATGQVTNVGSFGSVTVGGSTVTLDNVDALSFDPTTGFLYATHQRSNAEDLLFRVDHTTGQVVSGAFGGDDYVFVESPPSPYNGNDNIDGMVFDATGQLFAVATGSGNPDVLVTIDKTTGANTGVRGELTADTGTGPAPLNNVEGLTVDSDGNFFITTTDAGGQQAEGNTFFSLNESSGLATAITSLGPTYKKLEALACGPAVSDLSVDKSVDESSPPFGSTVTFTVDVTNSGPEDASNVTVSDELPDGFDYVSHTATQGTYDDATGVWNVGTLANGSTATLTIDAQVNTVNESVNTASITGSDQFDTNTDNDESSVTVTPQARVNLAVDKTVNESTPAFGTQVSFVVTVNNEGPNAATNVTVSDQLPAGLEYVSHTASQGTYDPVTGVWDVGTLGTATEDSLAAIEIVALVNTTEESTNVARYESSDQADTDATDDEASATVTPGEVADLSLNKTGNVTAVDDGGDVSLNVTVENAGPGNATNVSVRDLLPTGLDFQSASVTQGSFTYTPGTPPGPSGSVDWEVGTLAPGANATITIVAEANVTENSTQNNVAEVTASDAFDPDSLPDNLNVSEDDFDNHSVAVTVPTAPPPEEIDLELDKTVSTETPLFGETITYTVTLFNNDSAVANTATNVSVLDLLPDRIDHVSNSTTQGTFDHETGIWDVGSLGPGENVTLTLTAQVNAPPDSVRDNIAQVWTADGADVDSVPGNNNFSEDDLAVASVQIGSLEPLRLLGDGEAVGEVNDEATNSGLADATVWAVRDDRLTRNALNVTLPVSPADDRELFVRLVDADTGEVVDNDDYLAFNGNLSPSVPTASGERVVSVEQLNVSDRAVGPGYVAFDLNGDGEVRFAVVPLEPGNYTLQVSEDQSRASKYATPATTGFTDVATYSPIDDLTSGAARVRELLSGADLYQATTDPEGNFVLDSLYTDEGRVLWWVLGEKPGFGYDRDRNLVTPINNFTGLLDRPLVLSEEPTPTDFVDVDPTGTYESPDDVPALSARSNVSTVERTDDGVAPSVPRDGTVLELNVTTRIAAGGKRQAGNVTVTIPDSDVPGDADNVTGEWLTLVEGGEFRSVDQRNDTLRIETGANGHARVFYVTDRNGEDFASAACPDVSATDEGCVRAILTNDTDEFDNTSVDFVGVIQPAAASLSGIVTNDVEQPVAGSVVWVERVDFRGDLALTATPDVEDGSTPDSFTLTLIDTAAGTTLDAATVSADRLRVGGPGYDFADFPQVSADDESFTLWTTSQGIPTTGAYTLPAVPASNDTVNPTTYAVRGAFDLEDAGSLEGRATSITTAANATGTANVVLQGAERSNFVIDGVSASPSEVAAGGTTTVEATVRNAGGLADTQDVVVRYDANGDGDFDDADDVLATLGSVSLDPGTQATVSGDVDVPSGLNGTVDLVVATDDDATTVTVEVTEDGCELVGDVGAFDADGDCAISTDELQDAINAWAANDVTTDTLQDVINAWAAS